MEAQKNKKKKKTKYSSKEDNQELEAKSEAPEPKNDAPPLKSEDYDGWKNWYKGKILKGLEDGKDEAFIAFELNIQESSIKKFLA